MIDLEVKNFFETVVGNKIYYRKSVNTGSFFIPYKLEKWDHVGWIMKAKDEKGAFKIVEVEEGFLSWNYYDPPVSDCSKLSMKILGKEKVTHKCTCPAHQLWDGCKCGGV